MEASKDYIQHFTQRPGPPTDFDKKPAANIPGTKTARTEK
jgi:hypothetical protein